MVPEWLYELMVKDRARCGGPRLRGRDCEPLDDEERYPILGKRPLPKFVPGWKDFNDRFFPKINTSRLVYSTKGGVLKNIYDEQGRLVAKTRDN